MDNFYFSITEKLGKFLPGFLYQWLNLYVILKPLEWLSRNNNKLPGFIEKYLGLYKMQIYSLQTYLSSSPQDVRVVVTQMRKLLYAGPVFIENTDEMGETLSVRGEMRQELKLLIFHDARIRGGSDVIIEKENTLIYELLDFDLENRYDYRSNAITLSKYHNECIFSVKPTTLNLEKGIKLVQHFSFNYYHFFVEVVSRFYVLDKNKISVDVPLLLDEVCQKVPQFMELIKLFNKDNRKIIFIKRKEICLVRELYYVSEVNIIPPDYIPNAEIRAEDMLFDPEAIQYMRQVLLPKKASKNYPKRIFISRKNASKRRGYNEDEVWSVLQQYGFEMVYPEKLSVTEQIALFNSAEWIAGTTGAAFTNILYCKEGCNIICFTNIKIEFSGFSGLAKCVGANMIYFFDPGCQYTSTHSIHQNFIVNTHILNAFLKRNISY